MRPISLVLDGFASFRDRAELDFADTDYFALVGPTGSGKSTVLDAITFALYGTAPRWGSRNAVADALAPTANRCTVSLVFDVGAQRYQVAREVRRSGRTINQRSVSLVQFHDPTALVADADTSTVLAGEVRELTPAIESLLGLGYEDFCQCVVLPQGQFARFLSASVRERQEILLKLLGANQYEGIGRRAGEIADRARQRAELLTEQLGDLADATAEAEQLAIERLAAAEQRESWLSTALPRVVAAVAAERDARTRVAHLSADLARLAGVAAPDDIVEVQRRAGSARDELTAAAAADRQDTAALTAALEAAQAGPSAVALDQWRRLHAERDHLRDSVPGLEESAQATAATVARTADAVADATAAVGQATTAHLQAEQSVRTARDRVAALASLDARLARVATPRDLVATSERVQRLTAAAATADRDEAAAEADLAAARAAQEQLVRPELLEAARGEVATVEASRTRLDVVTGQRDGLAIAAERSAAELQLSRQTLARAEEQWDAARQSAAAASLRPHLQVGHDCPVCTQPVAVLPARLDAPELAAAGAERDRAEAAHDEHRRAADAADRAVAEVDREIAALQAQQAAATARLHQLLPQLAPGTDPAAWRAALTTMERERAEVASAAAAALQRHTAVREHAAAVRRDLDAVRQSVAAARAALARAVGELSDLEPPQPPDDAPDADLADHWRVLVDWVAEQRTEAATAAGSAADDLAAAEATAATTGAARTSAEAAVTGAQSAHTAAVAEQTRAAGRLEHAAARLADLDTALSDAPAGAELDALLAQAAALADAVTQARTAVAAARDRLATAEAAVRTATDLHRAALRTLTETRDQLATLGPPALDVADLTEAWQQLTAWAAERHRTLLDERSAAEEVRRAAASERHARLAALATATGLDLTGPTEDPSEPNESSAPDDAAVESILARASREVTLDTERARAELARIRARRHEAAERRAEIEAATQRQRVADSLRLLMRSNNFPQWLASTALDSLVAGASLTLRRLSGDQFDLTHEKGEFYVIDHSDADSTRSVRTLSGGETFQASLALALALSDHLAGMAGTVKLESIFLDEGFGTLDPDSLETVAATLENLAQGDRTVGVITHVAALADRAPVRFQVRRDSRTSSVTREGW